MTLYALQDLRNYAKRGDEITVISQPHHNVWICSTADGNRFPCSPELLSVTSPVDVVVEIVSPVDLFNQPNQ